MILKPVNFLLVCALAFFISCNSANKNSDSSAKQQEIKIVQDFENAIDGLPNWRGSRTIQLLDSTQTHSGIYVCLMNDTMQYGLAYQEKIENLNSAIPKSISVEGWLKSNSTYPNVSIIVDIKDDEAKLKSWKSFDVDSVLNVTGTWKSFNWTTDLSKVNLEEDDDIKIYLWNKSKQEVLLDDFVITFIY